jgi:putative transposase
MTTKVMRYKIIKPINCEWKLLGKVLRDIQYDTRHILNKTIQCFWEWQWFSSDYKKQYGLSIKSSDISSYKSFIGYIKNFGCQAPKGSLIK